MRNQKTKWTPLPILILIMPLLYIGCAKESALLDLTTPTVKKDVTLGKSDLTELFNNYAISRDLIEAQQTPIVFQMKGGASHSTSVNQSIPSGAVVGGGYSKATRNGSGVTLTLHATELTPGYAYTIWVVVFNDPDACVDGCDGPDLIAANGDVLFVAGNVAGGSGKSTFTGYRKEGDNSNSLFAQFGLPAPGLIDALTAELHLIVRCHGAAIPGLIPEQIHTFQGGCTAASSEGLGDGPNTCVDVQFSVHLAP